MVLRVFLPKGRPMVLFSDIAKADNGARFYNADLHVHSFGASADVKDKTMTVAAVIDAAVAQEIAILAFTDHNTDKNLEAALDYVTKYTGQLVVLPGVEVTTAHGHLLVYFAPDAVGNVAKLLAKVDLIGERGAQDSHTAKSMADVIAQAERLGGICVAAHIDREKTGFEMLAAGFPNWKKDILGSSGLFGVEVDDPAHLAWYSTDEESSPQGAERRKLLEARAKSPTTAGRVHLAHLQGSDSHSLSAFMKRTGDPAWTRFKLNDLSFDAVRTALIDPQARVRAVGAIPRSVPRVRGMHVVGGFLDGETYHFSDNLNCFIGGRGTGKSTAIRSLAYGLGLKDDLEECGNCPDCIVVYCEDGNGVMYRYERRRGGDLIVKAKDDQSISDVPRDSFRLEFYGQGELADVAKDPLSNASLFQEFLDRHIHLRDLQDRERDLLERLAENEGQLIPLEATFAQLPGKKKLMQDIDKKLKIAEEGNLREIAGLQARLAAEKSLRTALEGVANGYAAGIDLSSFLQDYQQLATSAGALTEDASSKPLLQKLQKSIEDTNGFLNQKEAEITAGLKSASAAMAKVLSSLKQQHLRMESELNSKIGELRAKGLSGNITELQTLLKQRNAVSGESTRIERQRAQLEKLRSDRQEMVADLHTTRETMMERRKNQLKSINKNLMSTIKDYTVFVRYEASGIIEEFVTHVMEVMHGSYFQEEPARKFCLATTPAALAALVRKKDITSIGAIAGVGQDWATEICNRFGPQSKLLSLETLWKPPCPVITVRTKGVSPKEIPVNQLSDGQKHTILLTIAMLAESNLPLVIDQPEDDLDNGFIFSSVVATLRTIKEQRQIILVTHNANIAVLGDSELLFPMKRTDDKGEAVDRGSIDRAETKQAVQTILEGGELAFRRRKEIYGY